ncbi:MAG: M56 family metallopeptidase [Gemmatimonadetes bacterium]|nr:M56 family metallopeptidase [Gemmatimonadota bacterium]
MLTDLLSGAPALGRGIAPLAWGGASLWFTLALASTALLALAWLATRGLRHAPAATRFVVWTGALAGIVTIAAARIVLPAQPVAVDWWPTPSPDVAASASGTPATGRNAPQTITLSADANGNVRTDFRDGAVVVAPGGIGQDGGGVAVGVADDVPAIGRSGASADNAPIRGSGDRTGAATTWLLLATAVWLLGALVVAARFLHGTWRVRAMVRHAPRNLDGRHWTLLQQLAERMGVERPVSLRWVDDGQVPVATGIVHPVILLPRVATTWPDARLRMVLQHELAHVARADVAIMTAAQLALVLCWWHPLVWLAVRRMEEEREQACDDRVLTSGVPAIDYADELVQVVRALRTPAPAAFAALGMARRGAQVESRLRAVLDPATPRERMSRALLFAVIVVVIGVAPLGRMVPSARADVATAQPRATAAGGPGTGAPGVATMGIARGRETDLNGEFRFGDPCEARTGSTSVSRSSSDSLQRLHRVDPTGCLRVEVVGTPALDVRDVPTRLDGALPSDARLIIEEVRGGHARRITVRPDARTGALVPRYEQDSAPQSPDAAAPWALPLYTLVARDLGFAVHTRLARLLRDGGVPALERELRAIRADDVAERYLEVALTMPLGADERTALLSLVRRYAAAASLAARRRLEAAIATASGETGRATTSVTPNAR